MTSSDRVAAFKLANAHSPIVMSEWLDAEKRPPKGPPETWLFRRFELADGRRFLFTREECALLPEWSEQWWHGWSRLVTDDLRLVLDASAIETGTAETEGLGPKDESAVPQGDAQ